MADLLTLLAQIAEILTALSLVPTFYLMWASGTIDLLWSQARTRRWINRPPVQPETKREMLRASKEPEPDVPTACSGPRRSAQYIADLAGLLHGVAYQVTGWDGWKLEPDEEKVFVNLGEQLGLSISDKNWPLMITVVSVIVLEISHIVRFFKWRNETGKGPLFKPRAGRKEPPVDSPHMDMRAAKAAVEAGKREPPSIGAGKREPPT